MKTENMLLRAVLLLLGLIVMAFGVAFSIKAALGISPISSVLYVTSELSGLSVGTTTIIVNFIMIALEFVILRRKSSIKMLLQIPATFIFGTMIDVAEYAIRGLTFSSYIGEWIYAIISIFLLALGISLEMMSRITNTAGEGVVQAVTMVFPIRFGTMKVLFDVTLVVISLSLSFIFDGHIIGIREGTLAAALFVGTTVKILRKPLMPISKRVAPVSE